MTIVRKVNKKGHVFAFEMLPDGKLKRVSWDSVHERIKAGLPVAILTYENPPNA